MFLAVVYLKFLAEPAANKTVENDVTRVLEPEINLEDHIADMDLYPDNSEELKLDLAKERVAHTIIKNELTKKSNELV